MEGVYATIPDLEDRITKIIDKLKTSSSRPCYQTILDLLKKGQVDIGNDTLITVMDDLVKKKVVQMNTIRGKESFSLVKIRTDSDIIINDFGKSWENDEKNIGLAS